MKSPIVFEVRVKVTASPMNRLTGVPRIPQREIENTVSEAVSEMAEFEGADVCADVLPKSSKKVADLTDAQINQALDLLDRAAEYLEAAPDNTWWREYYVLTGEHVVLTEEGWTSGGDELDEEVLDEVNAPQQRKRVAG